MRFSFPGTNSDFEERLQELIEIRDDTILKAELYREYLLDCVKRMYEAEASQAEEDYSVRLQIYTLSQGPALLWQ